MKILVKDGIPGRKVRGNTNIKGVSGKTYANLKLWDRQQLVDDGIYDFIDAKVPEDHRLLTEENVINEAAGTVTYTITTEAIPPQPEQPMRSVEEVEGMMQTIMDEAAQAKGYDSIASAVTYADEPTVPVFQAEGAAFRAWRSEVWEWGYTMLALRLPESTDPLPTRSELEAAMPQFVLL